MTFINLIILGIFIIIIACLTIAMLMYKSLNKDLLQRKVSASPELIELVETEMKKALKYHNTKKYEYYRNIFNDLEP